MRRDGAIAVVVLHSDSVGTAVDSLFHSMLPLFGIEESDCVQPFLNRKCVRNKSR